MLPHENIETNKNLIKMQIPMHKKTLSERNGKAINFTMNFNCH